jgi:uncharacterized protein YndB with AHSA1/START domain
MRFENRVVIQRPPDEVFAFIADFTHMPLWNYYLLETRQLSEGHPGVGTHYVQRRKTDTQRFHIVAYQPNHLVAIQLHLPTLPVRISFQFEAADQGVKVVDTWELWSQVPIPGAIERRITHPIQMAVAENLGKLKQLLEAGQVQLQDGRISHRP